MGRGTKVQNLTKCTQCINFCLFLVVTSAVFVALNAAMLPFAYLKTVFVKMTLSYRGVIRVSEVFVYLMIGLPMLLVLQVMDLVAFLQWSAVTEDPTKKNQSYIISNEHFEMFYNLLYETFQQC